MTHLRAFACALLIAMNPAQLGAQQMGRLFFSPAERSLLDSLRKAKPPAQKPAAPSPAEAQSARLDGYVVRSDGKSTVWVNGSAVARAR
jgi:hypothetical protein